MTARQLAGVIEKSVMPEIASAAARMAALQRIPPAHRHLVDRAQQFLTLRAHSWRLRIDALRKSSTAALRTADKAERVSLDALASVRTLDAALRAN